MLNTASPQGRNTIVLAGTLFVMIMAASFAWVLVLVAGFSWQSCAILMLGMALLIGGIMFSILEMNRIADRKRAKEVAAEIAAVEAFEALLAAQRAQAERELPPEGVEPYRHHEEHEESPGYDQGQLTSRLSGTTPFLKDSE
ncbi:MAG TPA: hypothetical protein VEU96_05100 [Bryobacteraceae bacterium]|nr:hypothetical protein [Bryobacteraceae bacterium]